MKSFKFGFTIIETMLFLGITGLLIMGILVGTGTSLSTQRYNDSVRSLQSRVKKAYSDVLNVNNERSSDWTCSNLGNSITITQVQGGGTNVGQSDCLLMGKLITKSNNSADISIKDVLGSYTNIQNKTKVSDFDGYVLAISPASSDTTYSMEWGTSTYLMNGSTKYSSYSILILRSPTSGAIRTFVSTNQATDSTDQLYSMINPDSSTNPMNVCVDSDGLFGGRDMAVKINANASGADGVELLGENSGCER